MDASYMFYLASSFNRDISYWNVKTIEEMRSMFNQASIFDSDLSSWQVSNVRMT
jgi:hypothetical protein